MTQPCAAERRTVQRPGWRGGGPFTRESGGEVVLARGPWARNLESRSAEEVTCRRESVSGTVVNRR